MALTHSLEASRWLTEISPGVGAAFSLQLGERLHEETSPWQHLEVYSSTDFGNVMLLDGCIMLTDRDNFIYHEMMTHPALLTHAKPRQVVIIGGGDCGSLRECLRHPDVALVRQIDIDERVTRVSEQYFPQLTASNDDPRAELAFIDGVKWMQECEPGSLDVIIVDSTDPVGPAEGLFQASFYAACHRALADGGIIVQQSESPLYHGKLIGELHGCARDAGFDAVRTLHFPLPSYPSGWWSATLAGKGNSLQTWRSSAGLSTDYYSESVHAGALSLPPFLQRQLG